MPTLSAMFRLFDGYSSTVRKISEQTEQASKTILKASKENDKLNESLKATETAAGTARNGLTKLIGAAGGLAALKKGMDLTDTYTNTNARLAMITNSMEEQAELQKEIFAAANRARGQYDAMANSAAKLSMLAGESFNNNEEAVAFTELLTKSLKVSGAGQAEQNSAFLQLTQALTSGRLQGDEFRSVMENAPMVADAIASYMGRSKSELKELSSQGVITSDIIKGAMFAAADDINGKFETMPMTSADIWNRIQNIATQAFGNVFKKANAMLNSDIGQQAISNLTGLIYVAAGAFEVLLDAIGWVGDHVDVLTPLVLGLASAWLVYNSTAGISWLTTIKNAAAMGLKATADWAEYAAIFALIWAQEGLNAALAACPITWIITGVMLLIAAFYAAVAIVNHFAGTSISATGLVVGTLFAAGALIGNLFIGGLNLLAGLGVDAANLLLSFAELFANFLDNPVLAIMNLIVDLANFVVGVMQSLAKVIDTVFGSNLADSVGKWSNAISSVKAGITSEGSVKFDRIDKTELLLDRLNYGDAFGKGYGIGASASDKISGLFGGPDYDLGNDTAFDFSQFATAGSPATVKGTGNGGAVKVENEEDIEWMRKLAERDYVARIAQNTLAPNIRVEFTGPVTKEADTDGVMAHVAEQLKEIIATAPEGVYP